MKKDKYIGKYINNSNNLDIYSMVGRKSKKDNFQLMAEDIIKKLNINKNDIILDFACGNGEITKIISKHCKQIIGVDFSKYLIDYAKKYNSASNITYLEADHITFFNKIDKGIKVNKAYSNEGVNQYLKIKNLTQFIKKLLKIMSGKKEILMAGSLFKTKKFIYYNSLLKKVYIFIYEIILLKNKMGYWYDVNELFHNLLDNKHKLILLKNKMRPNYRFDFIIMKND